MPESHKHQQERPITDRSGRSVRARLRLAAGDLSRAKDIMQEKSEIGM
ncbi:MAG: hypothetical protein U9N46_02820 [Euryarchaeota archaeon]|nr:hypothetical protein [Euryarchaeota archaeon]